MFFTKSQPIGTVACACLDTSRLATLAEPSKRHGTTKRKKIIQSRAMRSCALIRLHKLPHLRSATFWIYNRFYTVRPLRYHLVYDDAIHIYFNSPLKTSPDGSQGFSLCDKDTLIPVHVHNSLEMRIKTIRLTITI